jgi:hypothetical protein
VGYRRWQNLFRKTLAHRKFIGTAYNHNSIDRPGALVVGRRNGIVLQLFAESVSLAGGKMFDSFIKQYRINFA